MAKATRTSAQVTGAMRAGTAAISFIVAPEAWAQTAAPPPDAIQVTPNVVPELGDIIVTAQRRAETAQSVPVAITAIGSEKIQAASIKGLDSLTKGIVGIQYDAQSTQRPELFIRGIGTNRFDIGSDPSSGIYIDEIYQPRFANVLGGLVDIARVEVLRGPQGTLFGRNTIGGAVSVFTEDPTRDLTGRVSGSYGNKDYVALGGTVSGPLSDRLRIRLSGGYSNRDGFMYDTVSGRENGTENVTVRAKLQYDLAQNTDFQLAGSYFDSKQRALLNNPASLPLFVAGPLTPQVLDNDPFSGAYTFPGGNRIKDAQVDSRLTIRSDALTATMIGSWIGFRQSPSQDLDGSVNDNINYFGNVKSNTFSGELRLASTDGGFATFDDRFTWVAGVYGFSDVGDESNIFTTGVDSIVSFILANPTFQPPFNRPTMRKTDQLLSHSNLKSIAVYGQGTFDLTETFGVTLGGRYTHDRRRFRFRGINGLPGVPIPLIPADFVTPGTVSASAFDPKVGVEYKPSRGVLAYATYSRGFKGAAIQSTAPNALVASRVTRPERVDAYEIGLKSDLLDRRLRLNISAFVNKFKDLQVRRVVTFPGGFSTAISENAATSTIKGVEVETSALVTRDLRLDASYAYLDARYDAYVVDSQAGLDFSGNRLPRAPRHRFNVAATYSRDLSNGSAVQLRASYNYTGSFYFQPNNLAIEKERPYGLTDLSATFTLPNTTTSIQAWGRNVFGVVYRNYLDPLDQERVEAYGDRATYGVTLTQRF